MQINSMKKILAAPQEEVRVNRIWQGIETRRYRFKDRVLLPVNVWIACGAAAVALLIFITLYRTVASHSPDSLTLADSTPVPTVLLHRHGEKTVFSDGSSIALKKNAQMEVLTNTKDEVQFLLRHGYALFDVVPKNERTWKVNCSGVEVVVVGTSFVVNKKSAMVEVKVFRGTVLVKGDGIENGIQRLDAGNSVSVPLHEEKGRSTISPNIDPSSGGQLASPSQHETAPDSEIAPSPISQQPAMSWKEHAKRGDYRKAYGTLGAEGLANLSRQSTSAAELFSLADVARKGGRPRDAVLPLEKIIRSFPNDQKAGLASYTLARLQLEQLGSPGEAAVLFEYSISLNLPAAMVETAMAKRVQAFAKIGDKRKQIAGEEYLKKYPTGKYRTRVENWMHTPVR